jgi:hypothetical protein
MKSFKFFNDNSKKIGEEGAKSLLTRLIMTGEYATTIYPKTYLVDGVQYLVHSVSETIDNGLPSYSSNITLIGGDTHQINLFISP